MNFKTSIKTFFYIGLDKLSLSVFQGIDKKIFEEEILINRSKEKEDFDSIIDKFFGENIIKAEKKIGNFINEIPKLYFKWSNALEDYTIVNRQKKLKEWLDFKFKETSFEIINL